MELYVNPDFAGYNPRMAKKTAQPRKPTREKPVKVPGTFNDLIRQSLTAKKPAGGWPKPHR